MNIARETVKRPTYQQQVLLPWTAWAGLVLLNAAVTARSEIIALQRNQVDYDPLHAWMMEGSSAIFIIMMFGVVVFLSRQFPLDELLVRWQAGLAYIAGSIIFSVGHVAGMFSLRFLLWPPIFGFPYDAPRSLTGNLVFEYQKDIVVFVAAALGMYLFNSMMAARQAIQAAMDDAKSTRRITLKCGVRTFYIEADRFTAAKAAANYAEVEFGTESYFARISLSQLEGQLARAGVRVARVHKSWIINTDVVREVALNGDGTRTITLASGQRIPSGRKYRNALDIPDTPSA